MLLSVTLAAARLAISDSLVRRYIRLGRLKAQRVGNQWALDERDVARFPARGIGRPKERR